MLAIADICGFFTWHILLKEQAKTLQHLRQAFRFEKSDKELRLIGLRVFQNLGKTAVDVLRMQKVLNGSVPIECSKAVFQKIDLARSKGNGMICLTAHFGNWELITGFIIKSGYTGTVIGKKIYYEPFNRVLENIRLKTGAQIIYRDQSPKLILKTLKRNELIGILPDQDVDSIEGVFIRFFGEWAYTPTAPAKISLASGAPILPLFMARDGSGYQLLSDELIWPDEYRELEREEAVLQITKRWSKVIENAIRQRPEQWAWMHRRWKTRPDAKMQTELEAVEKVSR